MATDMLEIPYVFTAACLLALDVTVYTCQKGHAG